MGCVLLLRAARVYAAKTQHDTRGRSPEVDSVSLFVVFRLGSDNPGRTLICAWFGIRT